MATTHPNDGPACDYNEDTYPEWPNDVLTAAGRYWTVGKDALGEERLSLAVACPRCTHLGVYGNIEAVIVTDRLRVGAVAPPPKYADTKKCFCTCTPNHPGRTPGKTGCGMYGPVPVRVAGR